MVKRGPPHGGLSLDNACAQPLQRHPARLRAAVPLLARVRIGSSPAPALQDGDFSQFALPALPPRCAPLRPQSSSRDSERAVLGRAMLKMATFCSARLESSRHAAHSHWNAPPTPRHRAACYIDSVDPRPECARATIWLHCTWAATSQWASADSVPMHRSGAVGSRAAQ